VQSTFGLSKHLVNPVEYQQPAMRPVQVRSSSNLFARLAANIEAPSSCCFDVSLAHAPKFPVREDHSAATVTR
jgi:hypothetical protein